jgi:hypothetical protein
MLSAIDVLSTRVSSSRCVDASFAVRRGDVIVADKVPF